MITNKKEEQMSIRKCEIADCNNIIELWKRTKEVGFFCGEDNPKVTARYIERNPNTSFVAECEGKIVGVIMSGHEGWLGFIHHTCVDSTMRGTGLGKRLVLTALEALKNEGIVLCSLVVYKSNVTGNQFWEHMGFTTRDNNCEDDLIYRNKFL
jgi:ribosomal protein S18 acetylase RimI-like enzyme